MSATETSIANLALQMCGVSALNRVTTLSTDDTKEAAAVRNCFVSLRDAELRRNVWAFAIKRKYLRPVAATDKLMTPGAYAAGTTYAVNDMVLSASIAYRSRVSSNLANTPATSPTQWEVFSGPLVLSDWDEDLTYYQHELVYEGSSEWLALTNSPTVGTTPAEGTDWHEITGNTVATTPYLLPHSGRSYAYVLPDDFVRLAPTDPRVSQLPSDWLIEKRMILTNDPGPLLLRYVRNETDASIFDTLFVHGLAARIALEIVEELTQSSGKKRDLAAQYSLAISDAKLQNAIEAGPTETDEDDWVTVRE